jgi:imidazolonepropionase-like amidohydrolase
VTPYLLISLVLCLAAVPLVGSGAYLMTRHLAGPVVASAAWLYFAVGYWWPLGWWLSRRSPRVWTRLVLGYLFSIPLYFAALAVAYASLGYHFAPRNIAIWRIYLSASPWFYLYVVALWWLVRRPGWLRSIAQGVAVAVAVAAIATPAGAWLLVDDFSAPADASRVTRIMNVRVVDPLAGVSSTLQTVVLNDGRIVRVEEATTPEPPSHGTVIDGHGAFLAPGLIDVHAHLQTAAPSIDTFSARYAVRAIFGDYPDHRREYLASGVTSVRDTGGAAPVSWRLRDELRSGRLAGPRLFTVGRLVTSPGGHPVSTIWPAMLAGPGAIQASSRAPMVAALEADLVEFQPDAIKVIYGTIGRAKTHLTEPLLVEAVRVARRHGVPSIVHTETVDDVTAAARTGATGIEHVASIGALPESLLQMLREKRPFVDPTFGEYRVLLRQQGIRGAAVDAALDTARAIIARLAAANVPIVAGTDAPLVPFGTGLHDELAELERAGLSRDAILRIVTVNNAAYLNRATTLGRVEPGFRADLILLRQNPLERLDALRHPLWTMVDGIVMWDTSGRHPSS